MTTLNNNTPLVSICIPAHNSAAYIGDTLQCLRVQTYSMLEIIVVDDASTDNTAAVVQAIPDPRIRLIKAPKGGAAKARNTAFVNAAGSYIVFFDADDYVKPDFIQKQLEKIYPHEDAVVLSAWGRLYQNNTAMVNVEPLPEHDFTLREWITTYWYRCNPMTTPGRVMLPRNLAEQAGLWNESLHLNDDLEFYTRLFAKADRLIFNPDAVFYYRSGIKGLSSVRSHEAYKSLYHSILWSVQTVLPLYDNDPDVVKCCANMLQSFIYETYPHDSILVNRAQQEIKKLSEPDYHFHAGGFTKLLSNIIGWKATKRFKLLLS